MRAAYPLAIVLFLLGCRTNEPAEPSLAAPGQESRLPDPTAPVDLPKPKAEAVPAPSAEPAKAAPPETEQIVADLLELFKARQDAKMHAYLDILGPRARVVYRDLARRDLEGKLEGEERKLWYWMQDYRTAAKVAR